MNNHRLLLSAIFCLLALAPSVLAQGKTRLFILSGQSNMVGLDPNVSFTPALKKAFPQDEILVVKDASSGQPIRRWYRDWKGPADAKIKLNPKPGDLYDRLLVKVNSAIKGKTLDSVAFVWMQGEADAQRGGASVYEASMRGLIEQLRKDLKRPDLVVVIGRLSDYKKGQPDWDTVRAAQVKVGESQPTFGWVDTDDLNGANNGLHYNKTGYAELGRRFADKAVMLITNGGKKSDS